MHVFTYENNGVVLTSDFCLYLCLVIRCMLNSHIYILQINKNIPYLIYHMPNIKHKYIIRNNHNKSLKNISIYYVCIFSISSSWQQLVYVVYIVIVSLYSHSVFTKRIYSRIAFRNHDFWFLNFCGVKN